MAAADYVSVVQQLYVSYFGRPADYWGLKNMTERLDAIKAPKTVQELNAAMQAGTNKDLVAVVNSFATSPESIALYGNAGTDTEISKFVSAIYTNLLNRPADTAGRDYWVNAIKTGAVSKANAAIAIAEGALSNTSDQGKLDALAVTKKITVATDFTASLDTTTKQDAYSGDAAAAVARNLLQRVDNTTATDAFHTDVLGSISDIVNVGGTVQLGNGTDILSGTVFNAGLVYTPSGSDRINSLQSEDVLTGRNTGPNANNTLNATLGNANDNGSSSVTPTLKNIQTINLEVTGNTNTLDVRFADSLKSLNINKLTKEASDGITVDNIGQPAANLSVKNSAAVAGDVKFQYIDGVLAGKNAAGTAAGGDVGNLTVSQATLDTLFVGNVLATEGFETINLNATGNNTIHNLAVVDAETVKITGSGNLNLINNTTLAERVNVGTGGITIGDGIGVRSIDATAFTGNLQVNVSTAVGGHNDPANSGAKFYTNIKLGAGNDTLWTTSEVTGEKIGATTLSDTIDGGTGTDTLRTFSAGVGKNAKITNIDALELRGNGSTAWISAFDAALTSVLVRNETGGAQTFNLNNTTKALAEGGKIVLRHAITGGNADVVNVNLADATGAADTVAVTVENDLNTGTTYNYTITAQSQVRADGGATQAQLDATKVENLTINDNDTETNIVTVTRAADHTGTVKLTGGTDGLGYTVLGTLVAKTVDASAQLSDLNLTVGKADQKIMLGAGDDTLTFDSIDTFNGFDTLSDVGGVDTVRAAFSKEVSGTPDLTGIEKLHIVATSNTTLDLSKGQGIAELAILSDKAVDADGEIFSKALTSVNETDIITLKNTALNAINFFGDTDGRAPGTDVDGNGITDSLVGAYTQRFNGVTLENNNGATVAVNIGAPLKNGADSLSAGDGVKLYSLGQLNTHGVKDLSIVVSNEYAADGTNVDASVLTKIANIWDRDLVNLTLQAQGSMDLGIITGNTVNSNLKTFDASKVGGNVTATVKALGDSAVVTLAGGNDDFNALGSAGNNVRINAGDGNNKVVGTAQSDYITTGSGNDVIDANRGNNTVTSGAGNDTVSALNGSNTVDVGSGWADSVTFNYDTVGQQNLATNVIAGSGTNAIIGFNENNTGPVETSFGFAVGNGAELSVKFTGTNFDGTASTLNGRSALVADAAGVFTGVEANLSNLFVVTNATATVDGGAVTGGAAADVFLDLRTGVQAEAYNVSTGAGNDAIVIGQTNTGAHIINGGVGADRVILASAAGGIDELVVIEGDSNRGSHDIVTNFHLGEDVLDLSGTVIAGTDAHLTKVELTADYTLAVTAGRVTIAEGAIIGSANGPSVDSVLAFLSANANTNGDAYFVQYDSNGNGAYDAADNVIVFVNQGTDIVVELVGSATNDVSTADINIVKP